MAREDDRNRIARVRATDRARTTLETEAARLLGVRARLAVRDLDEREPRAPLEVGSREIERQLELPPPAGEVLGELLACLRDERARSDRRAVAPLEPLQAALGRDNPQRQGERQRSAPSSCSSCTFRSSPPA